MGVIVPKENLRPHWASLAGVFVGYTFLVFLIQVRIFAQLDSPYWRINVMVPLCVEIASLFPLGGALAWAFVWGYVVDVFSGRFWGGQVGTFLFAVGLQAVVARHLDLERLLYRMVVAGVCVVLQGLMLAGVALGVGHLPQALPMILSQGVLSCLAAPLVMLPARAIMTDGQS
ncbi:hypothetical protein SAMN02746041_03149 [Desulfacinum hydrothermale DSM 13146]|uniref:Rod shape-determining protein MreD n=1 Tax=Desulfacinum hydrothermale DSM 13146 TaxID=1121390 RepID=A0A1W1XVX1_9BACT|nr:hypothetical protein [Desulfacinum hydrothermale]SMC28005.1 hypothetical protein SAMN02746041_03149 [Desulfacinum hydrothermale DSM 13146]